MTTAQRKSLEPWLKDDVEYYQHQVDGIRRLARMRNFLLADDMGLGKSLQALTVFCMDVKVGLAETLLVVCPVTLRGNWADEIEKFTRLPYTLLGEEPDLKHKGHWIKVASPQMRQLQLLEFVNGEGPRVIICNYEQLHSKYHKDVFDTHKFDMVIFDEAHYIKNHSSVRTKAALRIISNRSALLTGTPMLNQADELWPIFHRIDPHRYPKYWSFVNRHCVMGGYKEKQVVGTKNQSELIGILSEIMVRRVKKDVLTLPEPYIVPVKVRLSDYQQQLYDEAIDELRVGDMELENALVKFLRLKQICTTPRCIDSSFPDDSEKLDRCIEIIDELASKGEKIVVFTQFLGALSSVVERIMDNLGGIPTFQLHGGVRPGDRQMVVNNWSKVSGPSVIVCMLQVAGVGLNMTAGKTGIFVDKLFVPGLNRQAIDRLHRIGQSTTQAVQIYELIASGTIEDRVEQILRAKAKLFGEIVEGSVSMRKLMEELMRSEIEAANP